MLEDRIYVPGGPVPCDSASYITRDCDKEALHNLRSGRFITILGARQMGKTSLLYRLKHELRQQGVLVALVDLSQFETLQIPAWYSAVFEAILNDLGQPFKAPPLPADNLGIYPFLTHLLEASEGSMLVVILDEVPCVPTEIADVFFSTLRSIHGRRVDDAQPMLKRVCFAFAGAFHPDELIRNPFVSPFNVSQQIYMRDFSFLETHQLVACLQAVGLEDQVEQLTADIHLYTAGQPYLAQRICSMLERWIVDNGKLDATRSVDLAVARLYEGDSNLAHVVKHVCQDAELVKVCNMIIQGSMIRFDRFADDRVRQLDLIGVVKGSSEGYCIIKNALYRNVLERFVASSTEHSSKLADRTESELLQARSVQEISDTTPPSQESTPISEMQDRFIRILHLSDIHRAPDAPTSNTTLLGNLYDDIRYAYDDDNAQLHPGEPRLGPPNLIVVSGDLTQRAEDAEFSLALQFLEDLLPLVGGDRQRIVVVPGNHDVNWALAAQAYSPATEEHYDKQPAFTAPFRQSVKRASDGTYWRKNDDTYSARYHPFKAFFETLYKGVHEFSLAREQMYTVYDMSESLGLVVVGFNSCDEVDAYKCADSLCCLDRRAFINTDAIYNAQKSPGFHAELTGLLRVAVFHHNIRSIRHGDDFLEPKYLQILKRHGFDLCLHGHVHFASYDLFDATHARILPVIGAGSLAVPDVARPPATPMGYNLVVLDRDSGNIWVHTRRHDEENLVWTADYRWGGRPYYEVRQGV